METLNAMLQDLVFRCAVLRCPLALASGSRPQQTYPIHHRPRAQAVSSLRWRGRGLLGYAFCQITGV